MRVAIHVKPGSGRTAVGGRHGEDDTIVVSVTARAVEGKATEAALRAVAEAFGVRRRDVSLVTGATSRDKVLDIDGDAAALAGRRDSLLGTAARDDGTAARDDGTAARDDGTAARDDGTAARDLR